MHFLASALAPRYLIVLLAILLVLLLLTALFLVNTHLGGIPGFVLSTDSILD
jgi:hypothetical protein